MVMLELRLTATVSTRPADCISARKDFTSCSTCVNVSGKFFGDTFDDLFFAAGLRDRIPDRAGDGVQTIDGSEVADAAAYRHDQGVAGNHAGNHGT